MVKKNHLLSKYLHLRAICPQFSELDHTTKVRAKIHTHRHTHTHIVQMHRAVLERLWWELDTQLMCSGKAVGVFEQIPAPLMLSFADSRGPSRFECISVCVFRHICVSEV